MKKFWKRLPVKVQACANGVGILACLVLIYIFLGSPVLTAEMAFHRAEKANLVGPGEVLATLKPQGQEYSHLVLAEAEEGVMLYAWDRWNVEAREFVYLAKDGPLTVAAAPGKELLWLQTHASLPVYLFDDYADAVRAELDLTLTGEYEGDFYHNTYQLESNREGEGYFAFEIQTDSSDGWEGQRLTKLRNVTGNSMADTAQTVIHAAVRLYDANGDLLVDTNLEIRSAASKAQYK